MSRRVSRNNTYTTGVSPSGFFRAEVVGVDGSYLSVKIPRLGLDNVYENVPFTGFTPSVGDKIWISFIEGKSAHILAFVGAGDTTTDITEVVAGTNLTGGGSSGAVTLSLDPNIIGDISIDGSVGTGNLTVSGDGFDDTMFSIVKSDEGAGYIKKGTGYLEIYALNDAETLNQDILFSGNVGIGVATPTDTLHVEGNIRVPSDSLVHNGKGEDVSFDGLAHSVELRTRNLSRVFVDGQGNVGINESAPSYTLDVNGTLHITGQTTAGGDVNFQNNALISSNASSTNIDHIWHNDASDNGLDGTWHFVSDDSYKDPGSSMIEAGGMRIPMRLALYTQSNVSITDRTYCGGLIKVDSSVTRTITVNTGTYKYGDQITVIRQGSGGVNFAAGPNVVIKSRNNDTSLAFRYSAATLICDSDVGVSWYLVGDLT